MTKKSLRSAASSQVERAYERGVATTGLWCIAISLCGPSGCANIVEITYGWCSPISNPEMPPHRQSTKKKKRKPGEMLGHARNEKQSHLPRKVPGEKRAVRGEEQKPKGLRCSNVSSTRRPKASATEAEIAREQKEGD